MRVSYIAACAASVVLSALVVTGCATAGPVTNNSPATSASKQTSKSAPATRTSTRTSTPSERKSNSAAPIAAKDSCDSSAKVEDSALGQFLDSDSVPVALIDPVLVKFDNKSEQLQDFSIRKDKFDGCKAISYVIAEASLDGTKVEMPVIFHWGKVVADPVALLSAPGIEVDEGSKGISYATTKVSGMTDKTMEAKFELSEGESGTFTTRSDFGSPSDVLALDTRELDTVRGGLFKDQAFSLDTKDGQVGCVVFVDSVECLTEKAFSVPNQTTKYDFFRKVPDSSTIRVGNWSDGRDEFFGKRKIQDLSDGTKSFGPPNFPVVVTRDGDKLLLVFADRTKIEVADAQMRKIN